MLVWTVWGAVTVLLVSPRPPAVIVIRAPAEDVDLGEVRLLAALEAPGVVPGGAVRALEKLRPAVLVARDRPADAAAADPADAGVVLDALVAHPQLRFGAGGG